MSSLYEHQLRTKATQYIQKINAEQGYHASINEESFEDYSVDIRFGAAGTAKLYYSPKRDYYTLVTTKIAKAHKESVTETWDALLADEAKPIVLKAANAEHQAFVDGSYDSARQAVGYGAVILKQGEKITELSGSVDKFVESHQIAGELSAAMRVIKWCEQNNINTIDIFYDYKGIEHWATGKWKLEKPMAKEYNKFMQATNITVIWHKVDSHTGVHWNEIADKLAKHGASQAEGNAKVASTITDNDTLLASLGEAFVTHLNDRGFQAEFQGVKNSQYARIAIYKGKKRLGYFDLYNTKKRKLDPYIHGFSNKKLQSDLDAIWITYKMQL